MQWPRADLPAGRRSASVAIVAPLVAAQGGVPLDVVVVVLALLGLIAGAAALWRAAARSRVGGTTHDGLTGLLDGRSFDADLRREAGRGAVPVAVLTIDLDGFARYNKTHGRAAGDDVLRGVAAVITRQLRADSTPYRCGGDTFFVLLPDADREAANAVAERIRHGIEFADLAANGVVTATVGVATGPAHDIDATVDRAEDALAAARTAGRNRVAAG